MNELVPGLYLPETRARFLAIVDNLRARAGNDGVILAGTELPSIVLRESHNGVPFLDTTLPLISATLRSSFASSA